ncbi:hypothetical protein SAMN02745248_01250 [Hathewaya proteolytica DSM 3090]|uniref:Transcriptional regulator, AbiEi antitoxin, Type IV TA system n=1 Tax=Hathewaya proteolytica DSM 3090 TaxID=1121331 RepID=A0A1M6N3M3_9CLOT|nr:DUF6088 family protein [Hathewaya proteolytica]SHJ90203.1 hypothetical protein SAMN02745248_01250 [Hathewaya proteolytica DSM 3090]
MNYQLEVRKKIEEYPVKELIIANRFLKQNLPYIPADAYYKSIERMLRNGELERVAKGVYCRPKITKFGKVSASEENILNYFIGKENYTGVVVGYRLYNKYGITTQVSKTVNIYSNILEEETKVIKNVQIKKINISINSKTKRAIEQLEILENHNQIEEIDRKKMVYVHGIIAEEYSDEVFTSVLRNMKYKKRTIAFLESILKGKRVENTLSQFLNKTSKYKIPTMEESYESAY